MPGDRIPHSVLPPAEMGTAPMEKSMIDLTTIQQEGLLDPKAVEQEIIYCLMAVEPYGYEHVEAVFVSEDRAQARKAVLEARQSLGNAQRYEELQASLPSAYEDMYEPDETCWYIRASKLIR
jgi:hypothetical protein